MNTSLVGLTLLDSPAPTLSAYSLAHPLAYPLAYLLAYSPAPALLARL